MARRAMTPRAQADHVRARRDRAGRADGRILDDRAAVDSHPERARGMEIDVGRRLAARHMLAAREHHRPDIGAQAAMIEMRSDPGARADRKSGVLGKSVSGRLEYGALRHINKKNTNQQT